MTFRVGQTVECIHDGDGPFAKYGGGYSAGLRNGSRYIVVRSYLYLGSAYVQLDRVKGGWRADRFRPIVEKKTDAGFAILEEVRKRTNAGEHMPIKVRESV